MTTIADSIAHIDPLTGDTIRTRLSHEDALRKLSIAVENFTRAVVRYNRSTGSDREDARKNGIGAEVRLAEAHADAVLALSEPHVGEPEFERRSA